MFSEVIELGQVVVNASDLTISNQDQTFDVSEVAFCWKDACGEVHWRLPDDETAHPSYLDAEQFMFITDKGQLCKFWAEDVDSPEDLLQMLDPG